ncbi:uncharacterized protein EDB91DRAFT_1249369 [Suillus paluster]|uniref:uncharacterized protein n=1 Tax=Suillus paluster TaxID=48578 RepID=UPI001B8725FB|nr:uncharacterized protein EDB91DRAFT_1249369 [Suillus paluster]KAG1738072.1 hypothetical protein EDB91DRAFT_1249369 [Suillus paluster]
MLIDNAPSTAAQSDVSVIYEGGPGFQAAANAMADECFLHQYLGVYYNIPAPGKRPAEGPPFFYVTCGHFIGVFSSWETTLNAVLGVNGALCQEVDSVALGKEKVRKAIEQGEAEIVASWDMKASRRYITGALPSGSVQLQPEASYQDFSDNFIGDDIDFGYMDDVAMTDDTPVPAKRRRTAADNPLLMWLGDHDYYLAELIRLDGQGDYTSDSCCQCNVSALAQFRCNDCCDMQLYCQNCIVINHLQSPTHCIKEWSGSFFRAMSLKKLGLRIQLGHAIGKNCILPRKAFNDDFVLIDTNGIHEIAIDFCARETSQTHTRQLLRMGWFPSTTVDPRTAATFRVLQHYQILSFESKASTYEFYHSLVHISDNTGLIINPSCWRHLKMLKRFGRGHNPAGVSGTKEGECAVLCPACPQPGKNLPSDWKEGPNAKRWLYSLFIAIDANFRLKRQAISTDEADPSLSMGWSYFVEEKKFKTHLKEHLSETQEKSSCSNHNAVNVAETKLSQGLAATGVGTVDCARHNFKHPNGVGDLQKGEKYVNMDYLFFSTLHDNCLNTLNVSYDIAFQWHKNLWSRMESLPKSHHISYLHVFIRFFIPKFHLSAHINKCQTMFSFNFTHFVGRTDGEAPEHGWSNINPVTSSTKAMGPGCRRDTLDDHFGDWNWKKVIGLAFNYIYRGINYPEITQAAARLKLVEMEAQELACGINLSLHPDISLSVLIVLGLDLEEEQHCVKAASEGMGLHVSDTQKGTLTRMRNVLRHKIETWRHPCNSRLREHEWDLWYTQAHDVLEELQQCLRVHCSMLTFKREWVRGQGSNTRAQNALACVHVRQVTCKKRYRVAWEDEDVKPLVDPFGRETEGRRRLTWIWMMTGVDTDGDGGDVDGVHVEWCKSRARAMRWAEEIELLHKEMQRVLQFLDWQAEWWDKQQDRCNCEMTAEREGLVAYANKQANIRCRLASRFRLLWAAYLPQPPLSSSFISGAPLDNITQFPDLMLPDL